MKNILELLGVEDIQIYFQPIVSLQKFQIKGVEALCRGINKNEIVPPGYLFAFAEELGVALELDRLCRERALQEYKRLSAKNKKLLLFLNHNPSLLDMPGIRHGYTWHLVKKLGIPPQYIILEISENKITNKDALINFVNTYKKYGFLFALDDVGESHSNLNRIPELKPNILKIDRALVKDVNKVWHKNKILKAISYMAREIGSIVIAEGVEKEEEIMECLEVGIRLFQGFYFSKPAPWEKLDCEAITNRARKFCITFRNLMVAKYRKRKHKFQYVSNMASKISNAMRNIKLKNFENRLKQLIQRHTEIECAYILNENGIQITNTLFQNNYKLQIKNHLFSPAQKGDDLSSKDYFYSLIYCDNIYYISEPYLSMATGNKCITISTLFEQDNRKYVLCFDIVVNNS
ncbi:EAL domain-containing protein [Desulfovulcanus sp.]